VETEWHLFRLLGLVEPKGYDGRLHLEGYEDGFIAGVDIDYLRPDYSGYHLLYGVVDESGDDDFGSEREDIPAPDFRGRVLARHKQVLPKDWQLQFELSYLCDRNFLEKFFPGEFFAGKEQETLLYAKKQQDNWAFASLMQYRLNRFETQTEAWPDLEFYLLGEPLWKNRFTFFHESRAGAKRFRPANWTKIDDSGVFARLDTRDEINMPLRLGPVDFVPYATGRVTYWSEEIDEIEQISRDGESYRTYGQVGLRASTDFWAIFNDVDSRLWDLHRLKHIITPEVVAFLASSHSTYPRELFPMDPDIEENIERTSGAAFSLFQRLQTKRGKGANRHTADWMRLNLTLGVYDNDRDDVPSDGRFFWYRPEYSLDRNHLNGEYIWHISDSTTLMADGNYDLDDNRFARGNVGLAVQRDPRLRYYAGTRYIEDADSMVGTFGVSYQINRKYSVSAFQQYDFKFDDGRNLSSSLTLTRKFPRWVGAFTFSYDSTNNEMALLMTFWPQGIEEVRIGGGKLSLLGSSGRN
jgi:hypothetical protein